MLCEEYHWIQFLLVERNLANHFKYIRCGLKYGFDIDIGGKFSRMYGTQEELQTRMQERNTAGIAEDNGDLRFNIWMRLISDSAN